MSNDRTIQVCRLDLSNPYTDEMCGRTGRYVIEINVTYSKGGISYYDYNNYPSAYYLCMRKKALLDDGCEQMTMFAKGESVRDVIEEAGRFNSKRLKELAAKAPSTELFQKLLAYMQQHGAVLA